MDVLQKLRDIRSNVSPASFKDDATREATILEARNLILALETPPNVIQRICVQNMEAVCCSIATKSGLFKALAEKSPQKTSELAEKTGVDPLLMGRVLRCLSAYGCVGQDGADVYSANMVSNTFSRRESEAALEWWLEVHGQGWPSVAAFLQKTGWKNFTGAHDTPLSKAFNMPPGADLFQCIISTGHQEAFNVLMTCFDEGHIPWTDFYPVQERLATGLSTEPDAVTMVDVGGGYGHQTIKFKTQFKLPGRHIVQDLGFQFPPEGSRPEGIEYMTHDFNTEQVVKGARFYYMRYVPHDWSQEECVKICSQLKKAMTPGYSKLIINELVVPEVNPPIMMTAMDMTMMAGSGGEERTEKRHRDYLEKSGLKVTGVWTPGDSISEGIIEAEVA